MRATALAFELVSLQEPLEQLSLAIARDRVLNMLLGLMAMWLGFDNFGSPPAAAKMDDLLRSNLGQSCGTSLAGGAQAEARVGGGEGTYRKSGCKVDE